MGKVSCICREPVRLNKPVLLRCISALCAPRELPAYSWIIHIRTQMTKRRLDITKYFGWSRLFLQRHHEDNSPSVSSLTITNVFTTHCLAAGPLISSRWDRLKNKQGWGGKGENLESNHDCFCKILIDNTSTECGVRTTRTGTVPPPPPPPPPEGRDVSLPHTYTDTPYFTQ